MTAFDAAEAEAAGTGPVVDIDGRMVAFPAKIPIGIAAAAQMQRLDVIYRILSSGDEDTLVWLLEHMDEDDFTRVIEAYGVTVGESDASAG